MAYGKIKADTLVYDNGSSDEEVTLASLVTKASTTGETFTGDITLDNQKELRLSEPDSAGDNYVGFEAPDTIASNVTWKLPNADGTAGQYLKTDGSANLSWGDDTTYTAGAGLSLGGTEFTLDLTSDQTWTGVQSGSIYDATTDASAGAGWAIDFADGNNQKVTLVAANVFTVQPTNQTVGQSGSIFITQPSSGSTVSTGWHGDFKWANADGASQNLTQTNGATDRLDYIIAAANTIHVVLTLGVA